MGTFSSSLRNSKVHSQGNSQTDFYVDVEGVPSRSYVERLKPVGSESGERIVLCKGERGKLVKKIEVFSFHYIRGIQVTYTDETSEIIGEQQCRRYTAITLDSGEAIKEANLSVSRLADGALRIGRIQLITTQNQILDAGLEIDPQYQFKHEIPVGSGYLVGIMGCVGISMLCLIFLKPIESVSMSNLRFVRPLGLGDIISNCQQLGQSKFVNNGHRSTEYDFTNSIQRENSYSFMCAASRQFLKNLKITAKIPKIVEIDGQFRWDTSETTSQECIISEITTLSWSLKGKIAPGESVTCTATCLRGRADVNFFAQVEVRFAGTPELWTYDDTGTLHNTVFACATAEALASGVETTENSRPTGQTAGAQASNGRARENSAEEMPSEGGEAPGEYASEPQE